MCHLRYLNRSRKDKYILHKMKLESKWYIPVDKNQCRMNYSSIKALVIEIHTKSSGTLMDHNKISNLDDMPCIFPPSYSQRFLGSSNQRRTSHYQNTKIHCMKHSQCSMDHYKHNTLSGTDINLKMEIDFVIEII